CPSRCATVASWSARLRKPNRSVRASVRGTFFASHRSRTRSPQFRERVSPPTPSSILILHPRLNLTFWAAARHRRWMSLSEEKLKGVCEQLKKGVAPPKETVRLFLAWFGYARRGYRVVRRVRYRLEQHGLITLPDFEYAYIDGNISFPSGTAAKPDK